MGTWCYLQLPKATCTLKNDGFYTSGAPTRFKKSYNHYNFLNGLKNGYISGVISPINGVIYHATYNYRLKEAGLAPGGWIRGLVTMVRKRRKNGCGTPSKWPLNRL